MTQAQTAWAALTGLLIAAAVVLWAVPTVTPGGRVIGGIFTGFGLLGWIILGGMIFSDREGRV